MSNLARFLRSLFHIRANRAYRRIEVIRSQPKPDERSSIELHNRILARPK